MPSNSTTSPTDEIINRYYPYIIEIRNRIILIVAVFLVAASIGFIYYGKIVITIIRLLDLDGINVAFTSPFQFFSLAMSTSTTLGVIATLPLVLFQALSFLKPALKSGEYRQLLKLLPVSIGLFALGFAFGFYMMRFTIQILYQKSLDLDIGNLIDISTLLSQVLSTSTLLGIGFQFPVVITLMVKLRFLSKKALRKQRPIAYALSLLFAALMPPTDIVSLLALTIPLVILYEITLLFNRSNKKDLLF